MGVGGGGERERERLNYRGMISTSILMNNFIVIPFLHRCGNYMIKLL